MKKVTFTFEYKPDLNPLYEYDSEGNKNLSEDSLDQLTGHDNADVIYFDLTENDWKRMNLNDDLWGQSQTVGTQGICYGRAWEDAPYQTSHYLEEPFDTFPEITVRLAHEMGHIYETQDGLCHLYFYGKETINSEERGEVKRDPRDFFDEMLGENQTLHIHVVRTIPITKEWKKQIEKVEYIITPKRMGRIRSLKARIASLTKKVAQLAITYAKRLIPTLKRRVETVTSANKHQERIMASCRTWEGRDPTPQDLYSDALSCVWSWHAVMKHAGIKTKRVAGTWTIMRWLEKSKRFREILDPEDRRPGDTYLYATGTARAGGTIPHGHILILDQDLRSLWSNDSLTGYWEKKYTLDTARERWEVEGKYPRRVFRVV